MKLKLRTGDAYLEVVDEEDTISSSYRNWNTGQLIEKISPKQIVAVNCGQAYRCCAIGEIFNFYVNPTILGKEDSKDKTQKAYEMIAEALPKQMKKQHLSWVYAAFLKQGKKNKEYEHQGLMDAMLKHGWKKLGPPFLNRRYSVKKDVHKIQNLIYLIDSNKKGNSYVEANAVS